MLLTPKQMETIINERCDGACLDNEFCPIEHICDPIHGQFGNTHPKETEEAYNLLLEPITPVKLEHDPVNHPSHYTQGGMECIDEMSLVFGKEVVKSFCLCNVWKYRKRAIFKNGQEDIDKSNWYMAKYEELSKEPIKGCCCESH